MDDDDVWPSARTAHPHDDDATTLFSSSDGSSAGTEHDDLLSNVAAPHETDRDHGSVADYQHTSGLLPFELSPLLPSHPTTVSTDAGILYLFHGHEVARGPAGPPPTRVLFRPGGSEMAAQGDAIDEPARQLHGAFKRFAVANAAAAASGLAPDHASALLGSGGAAAGLLAAGVIDPTWTVASSAGGFAAVSAAASLGGSGAGMPADARVLDNIVTPSTAAPEAAAAAAAAFCTPTISDLQHHEPDDTLPATHKLARMRQWSFHRTIIAAPGQVKTTTTKIAHQRPRTAGKSSAPARLQPVTAAPTRPFTTIASTTAVAAPLPRHPRAELHAGDMGVLDLTLLPRTVAARPSANAETWLPSLFSSAIHAALPWLVDRPAASTSAASALVGTATPLVVRVRPVPTHPTRPSTMAAAVLQRHASVWSSVSGDLASTPHDEDDRDDEDAAVVGRDDLEDDDDDDDDDDVADEDGRGAPRRGGAPVVLKGRRACSLRLITRRVVAHLRTLTTAAASNQSHWIAPAKSGHSTRAPTTTSNSSASGQSRGRPATGEGLLHDDDEFLAVDIIPIGVALGITRRRLYDVIAVLESLDLVVKLKRNTLLVRRYFG
jgi:hypothetical protein